MKVFSISIIALLTSVSVTLGAGVDPPYLKHPCSSQSKKLITDWGVDASALWRGQPGHSPAVTRARTPTQKIGVWVEITNEGADRPLIVESLGAEEVRVLFDPSQNCSSTIQVQEVRPLEKTDGLFTDKDLSQLIESGEPGIIYTWSPDFVYSMQAHDAFMKISKRIDTKVTTVRDPRTPDSQLQSRTKNYTVNPKDPKIESYELLLRNVSLHYPKVLVFNKKKLSTKELTGVYSDEHWEKLVKAEIEALK